MTGPAAGRSRRHRLVAAVAIANALGAGGGAIGLATGWLDLGDTITDRLPWGSATLGGVALAVIVALPNTVLAVVALRRDARSGPLSIAAGVALVAWIVVQLAFIRSPSFLHPLYAAVGLLQVWLGARVVRAGARASPGAGPHPVGDPDPGPARLVAARDGTAQPGPARAR